MTAAKSRILITLDIKIYSKSAFNMGVNMNVWEISGHAIHRHVICALVMCKQNISNLSETAQKKTRNRKTCKIKQKKKIINRKTCKKRKIINVKNCKIKEKQKIRRHVRSSRNRSETSLTSITQNQLLLDANETLFFFSMKKTQKKTFYKIILILI